MLPRPFFFNIMVNMTVYVSRFLSSICRAIILSVFLSGSIAAWAYEETTVSNGGTVTGTVQFSGELPLPMSFARRSWPGKQKSFSQAYFRSIAYASFAPGDTFALTRI